MEIGDAVLFKYADVSHKGTIIEISGIEAKIRWVESGVICTCWRKISEISK